MYIRNLRTRMVWNVLEVLTCVVKSQGTFKRIAERSGEQACVPWKYKSLKQS